LSSLLAKSIICISGPFGFRHTAAGKFHFFRPDGGNFRGEKGGKRRMLLRPARRMPCPDGFPAPFLQETSSQPNVSAILSGRSCGASSDYLFVT
jgi:hypothetical protein